MPENVTQLSLPDLAKQINAEYRLCEAAMQSGLQHALQAGRLLIEAKKLCPHGAWLTWIRDNFEGSSRTAQSYMQIVDRLERISGYAQRVADLSYREALRLVSEPSSDPPLKMPSECSNDANFPELSPHCQYIGLPEDKSLGWMVELYPADQAGYFHFAFFNMNFSEDSPHGYVDYMPRGIKAESSLLLKFLESKNAKPAIWITSPKSEEKPWYLLPETIA